MIYSGPIIHTHICTYMQMHTHACIHTLFGNNHEEEAKDFLLAFLPACVLSVVSKGQLAFPRPISTLSPDSRILHLPHLRPSFFLTK